MVEVVIVADVAEFEVKGLKYAPDARQAIA
jgi:hypothetical protein